MKIIVLIRVESQRIFCKTCLEELGLKEKMDFEMFDDERSLLKARGRGMPLFTPGKPQLFIVGLIPGGDYQASNLAAFLKEWENKQLQSMCCSWLTIKGTFDWTVRCPNTELKADLAAFLEQCKKT